VWGIDFMGPFLSSFGNEFIFLAMDCVSKWVEVIPSRTNEVKVVVMFLMENICARFAMLCAIISDQGTNVSNRSFDALLKRYHIVQGLATPYHPQTSGKVEVSNRQIKHILEKTMSRNRKEWADKLMEPFAHIEWLSKLP